MEDLSKAPTPAGRPPHAAAMGCSYALLEFFEFLVLRPWWRCRRANCTPGLCYRLCGMMKTGG